MQPYLANEAHLTTSVLLLKKSIVYASAFQSSNRHFLKKKKVKGVILLNAAFGVLVLEWDSDLYCHDDQSWNKVMLPHL